MTFTLDRFQAEAIKYLDQGRSVLVCAPTGTGKTLIADHVVQKALDAGNTVVYTAPVKALSNQKFRDYQSLHGADRVGLLTGDLVINRDAQCLVMTTEILRNMLLTESPPKDLKYVILDEIHFLDDKERGTTWEEVLIYLPNEIQILGLSATLSNMDEFSRWLNEVRNTKTEVVVEENRAVPLVLHLFSHDDGLVDEKTYERLFKKTRNKNQRGRPPRQRSLRGRAPQKDSMPTTHADVFKAIKSSEFLPYLYFVFSRKNAEHFAYRLASKKPFLLDSSEHQRCRHFLDDFTAEVGEDVLENRLYRMYEQGIGFHHAGLHVQLKTLVEKLYEQKLIKVLYCTSTFALGINMPARSVVFDGLKKYNGKEIAHLTTRQFMQKAGRAGRRGKDEVGHVIIRMDHDQYVEAMPFLDRYQKGTPEPVRSSFNLSFNSVVNLLARHPQSRIKKLVESSFLAFQLEEGRSKTLASATKIEKEIKNECDLGPKDPLPPIPQLPPHLRAKARNMERLRYQANESRSRCWKDFQDRVQYLQDLGYLDKELGFNAGANVLKHIQISEIFVTEMFLEGILDNIRPDLLFGLCCSIVQDFNNRIGPKNALDDEMLDLAKKVNKVRYSDPIVKSEAYTMVETAWSPELIRFGAEWAKGTSFVELLSHTDSASDIAGDLVGAFRRARDLVQQMISLWEGFPEKQAELRHLLRKTGRDEVDVIG